MSTLPLLPRTQGCFLTCSKTFAQFASSGFKKPRAIGSVDAHCHSKAAEAATSIGLRSVLRWNLVFPNLKKNIDHDLQLSRFKDWTWFWCLGCNPKMMSPSPLNGTSPPTFKFIFDSNVQKIQNWCKIINHVEEEDAQTPHSQRFSPGNSVSGKKERIFLFEIGLGRGCVLPHTCIFG